MKAVYSNGPCHKMVVGNIPLNFSKLFFKVLQIPNSVVTCQMQSVNVCIFWSSTLAWD